MAVLFLIDVDMPSNKPNISDTLQRIERSPDGASLIQATRAKEGVFVKRYPWEKDLTPEEEQEVLYKIMKYKPKLVISQWIARVVSTMFFVWFLLGCFSIHLVVLFSQKNVIVLSMICMISHHFCVGFARMQRDVGLDMLNRDNEIFMFNRRVFVESQSLGVLHGVIGLVAIIYRF